MGTQFTLHPLADEIINPDAVALLTTLHRRFDDRRLQLLDARRERQGRVDAGEPHDIVAVINSAGSWGWQVAPTRNDRVEIKGPVDTRTMIAALNSGTSSFVADFDDPSCSTWAKTLSGQRNVRDAHLRTLRLETCATTLELDNDIATLIVRPRDLHRTERDFLIDGQEISASLFDFGLMMIHSARTALAAGSTPRFSLPAVDNHVEAQFWNDVFVTAQNYMHLPLGTIEATVFIEADEMVYELHDCTAVGAEDSLAEAV